MEILILSSIAIIAICVVHILSLRAMERTTKSLEVVSHEVATHLRNTVGGRPMELHQKEIDLRERQAQVEQRKAELEIEIRRLGFEQEQKLQSIRLKHIEASMTGGDVEA